MTYPYTYTQLPEEGTPDPTQTDTITPDDPEVHFLTDARNGFSELSQMALLWEVQHRWPTGSRFAYNLYRHECRLILCGPPGTKPAIRLSREGVMQGCVWGMILYELGIMSLAEHLQQSDSSILQPWYADDFSLQGPASHATKLFHLLCRCGPSMGYYPEMVKCWVIRPL